MRRIGILAVSTLLVVAGSLTTVGPVGAGLPPDTSFSVETVDSPNVGRFTSIQLDRDGYPVVSYYDYGVGDLRVAHCNDPDCAGGDESVETVDSTGAVGLYTSLQLDSNGYPVVSYYDLTNTALKVAHCNDPNCTGGDESLETVDNNGAVGLYTSLQLDSNGYPVVSYYDATNTALKVAHCNDPFCSGGDESLVTADNNGAVGAFTSLQLDDDGNPVVSYFDSTNTALKVAHCNDPNCAGANESLQIVDNNGNVGRYTSLALDRNGYPVVSYYDSTNTALKLAHCNDPNCAGANESLQTVDNNGNVGRDTSVRLDVSGGPVISYYDVTNTALKVAHCNDPNCAGADEQIVTVDDNGSVGSHTSLTLRGEQYAVVSYQDVTNASLKVASQASPPPFYVMVERSGVVHTFPPSQHVGNATIDSGLGEEAIDIVINHEGTGYYVLSNFGIVDAIGPNTMNQGNLNLATLQPGETPAAMALTATGAGYWIFTNRGRAAPFGDATDIGDVTNLALQAPVVDAAPYPPGFYMTGGDGGVFTPPAFVGSQEVPFYGSVPGALPPGVSLNQPIVTIYVDTTDDDGYSLAASDGGMFNFQSEFCGSIPGVLPGVTLNQPVVNAVPYGECYIFFAADGGAFVFGDKPFLGSLGDNPPPTPIVSGDAYAT